MSKKRKAWDPLAKHVQLHRWLLEAPAYRDLDSGARDVLTELMYRHDGKNNGAIPLSVREAADRTNCAPGTALDRLWSLREHGFLRVGTKGSFSLKARHATEWTLTMYAVGTDRPTRDFERWNPETKEPVEKRPPPEKRGPRKQKPVSPVEHHGVSERHRRALTVSPAERLVSAIDTVRAG